MEYFNYHMHSTYSNVSTIDSTNSVESLIIRAKELGQKSFTISEHGNMISKYDISLLCKNKKYLMKQICSVEAYFVKDRLKETETTTIDKKTKLPTKVKDKTNAHMILIAKNKKGYKQLNTVLSYANIDGFYGKARIDLELINKYIKEEDVIITTACVGGFVAKYGTEIISEFQRFIDVGNFYIEFQAHNTDKQKEYNKIILDYAIENNIKTTVACDTHIIDENDELYRNLLLKRKGIRYDDEDGWYLDFPSAEELEYRFEIQGIIPSEIIRKSFENTIEIEEQCEAYDITEYELKIPVAKIHRHLTSEQRKDLLKEIIYEEFESYCERDSFAKNNRQLYLDAIEYELGEIFGCNTHDYFLLNYFIIKRGKELGGVLTKTSRGSAGCYIVNMFLHFTEMDRLQFDLPLLPERFMTKERLLLSHSAPDIDMNMADPKPFYEASKELLGDEYVYPMIALGRVQEKTGWKIFAATNGISVEVANEVSKAIDEYLKAKKYADEDAEVDIDDYIPHELMEDFNKSKHFRSVIENIKAHPCGYCVSPINLIEEIGLIKCKDALCVAIEGSMADKLGYVKNDYLVVSVVDIIDRIYKKIGIPQPSPQELLANIDDRVWDIYEFGHTVEVNQFTANRTKKMMETYKPKSVTDLSSAVAFLRPGCASIVGKLVKREEYSFGVKEIDDILFSHTGIGSYVLYQESIMKMLNYAGIDAKETYTILKAISKKKEDVIKSAKGEFVNGIVLKAMESGTSKLRAEEIASQIWKVIEDASAYSFNAPHSLAMSIDSLYIADTKIKYPTETYTTILDYYSIEKKKYSKVADTKRELVNIGETVHPIRMGYVSDRAEKKEDGYIQSILSAKGTSQKLATFLKEIPSTENPLLLYFKMKDTRIDGKSTGDKRSLTALCRMNFFEGAGNSKKIMEWAPKLYDMVYSKKQFRESSLDKLKQEFGIDFDISPYCSRKTAKTYYLDDNKKIDLCSDIFNLLPETNFTISELAINEVKSYGYLVNYADYKSSGIIDGNVKMISLKEKAVTITSHTTGNDLKVYMRDLAGLKKKMNILLLGVLSKNRKVYCNSFIGY